MPHKDRAAYKKDLNRLYCAYAQIKEMLVKCEFILKNVRIEFAEQEEFLRSNNQSGAAVDRIRILEEDIDVFQNRILIASNELEIFQNAIIDVESDYFNKPPLANSLSSSKKKRKKRKKKFLSTQ